MKTKSFIVKDGDVRPARPDGTCFYCRTPLGQEHAEGCVIRTRTVLVKFEVTMCRQVPEDWDVHMINFHMNDGSWCASNLITILQELDAKKGCLCGRVKEEFIREATEEDEERFGVA